MRSAPPWFAPRSQSASGLPRVCREHRAAKKGDGRRYVKGIQTFGFAIFIFLVGYQTGPQFFDVLLTSGLKYLSLALVVAGAGFGLAVWLANELDFAPGMVAGLMGGAMTTTPTLAAAQDAVNAGLYSIPAGVTKDQVLTNIGAAYALTYFFGLIGLIIVIRLMLKLLRFDLPAEAAKLVTGDDPEAGLDLSKITRRTYRVRDEAEIKVPGCAELL